MLLEKLIAAFSEAKGIVRHSLATSGGTRPAATCTTCLVDADAAHVLLAVCVTRHAMLQGAVTCPASLRAPPTPWFAHLPAH